MKELLTALGSFRKEMPALKQDSRNSQFKNNYCTLDSLISQTQELLTKNGLIVVQSLENDGVRTELYHVETNQKIESFFPLKTWEVKRTDKGGFMGANPAQIIGICITYTRRYAYESILGLSTVEDTDGNIDTANTGSNHRQPPPQSQKKSSTQAVATGWRAHKIHFGEFRGANLGSLNIGYLNALQTKWRPEANPSGQFYPIDISLRKALDESMLEMGKTLPVSIPRPPSPPPVNMPPPSPPSTNKPPSYQDQPPPEYSAPAYP